ncbi:hypothetical protein GCM10009067_08230 [Haloarcula sebkhae]|uniref:DUF8107 domain-containing protein n=4 Tax=Haloarcula TaxID=2237 RepID=A0A830EMD2_9EURY|nr:hypothetical protein [Haloarcula sebkhae]GGK58090.1 hypothetical protein GCM10009067_08230 [Haloarcula sebkhae]
MASESNPPNTAKELRAVPSVFVGMSDANGFEEGASGSQGDPRVLIAMNVVLSTVFAATIVWGLSVIGAAELTAINVATGAILLFALTYAITLQ